MWNVSAVDMSPDCKALSDSIYSGLLSDSGECFTPRIAKRHDGMLPRWNLTTNTLLQSHGAGLRHVKFARTSFSMIECLLLQRRRRRRRLLLLLLLLLRRRRRRRRPPAWQLLITSFSSQICLYVYSSQLLHCHLMYEPKSFSVYNCSDC